MASSIFTTWAEYGAAVTRVIDSADSSIKVFDRDLQRLPFERPEINAQLANFLRRRASNRIQIVVQDSGPLLRYGARLMRLLTSYGHNLQVILATEQTAALTDSLLIVDERHAVIRFHVEQARGKLIMDDAAETRPYAKRFADIVAEGGTAVSPGVPGL